MHRILAIVCPDYSGSTLLAGLLDNIPGVAGLGELHWILDWPGRRGVRPACNVHGYDCALLKEVCRPGLCPDNLYERCAESSGCSVLVSTDKYPANYARFLKPGESEAIVMFKRPEALLWSEYKRNKARVLDFNARYPEFYAEAFQFVESGFFSGMTAVEYERLAADPKDQMERLCRRLDLPEPIELRHPPRDWHHFGGNQESMKSKRYDGGKIILDERWREGLDKEKVALLREDEELMRLWEALKELAA